MKHYLACIIVAFAFLCGGQSQAAPIGFIFEGTVTSTFFDPFDPFLGTIQFDTPITGNYTFESTTPDAIPSPNVGSYSVFGAPFGMTVDIGGNTFSVSEFLNISVANDIGAGVDQYSVLAQEGIPGGLSDFLSIELFLEDATGTAFSSDALPLTPPALSDFVVRSFFLDGVQTRDSTTFQFQIQGSLSSLVIPEPSSVLLLGIGLFGLGFLWMWHQKTGKSVV